MASCLCRRLSKDPKLEPDSQSLLEQRYALRSCGCKHGIGAKRLTPAPCALPLCSERFEQLALDLLDAIPDGNTALPLLLYIPTCTKEAAATKSKSEAYERDLLWEDSVLDLAANVRASFILRPCLPLPRPCLTLLPACTLANAGRRRAPSAVYARCCAPSLPVRSHGCLLR